jgi:CPA2 family monovalent cation:H+ antiporter-2
MNLLVVAGVVLVLLAIAGATFQRFGYSVIPAYVLVGLAAGPHGLAVSGALPPLVPTGEQFRLLADLGVVLLLFFVGLELGLEQLFARREAFTRAGAVDVGVSAPLGFLLGIAVGFSVLESAFLALIVFNSSTVIIAKSLSDLGWLASSESDAILGVVVIEDVVTAAAFAVLSSIMLGGTDPLVVGRTLATGFAVLGAIVVIARFGGDTIAWAFARLSTELFILGTVGVAALVAGLGLAGGTSEAVAAFLAGTAFQKAGLIERVERFVAPLRDLAAALFFFLVGVVTDPRLLATTAGLVAVAGVVTVGGQLVSGYYAGRAFGLDGRQSVRVGTALSPRGEFSLVIAAFLATAGTTPTLQATIPAFTVGYVLVTSIAGTVLMRHADGVDSIRRRLGRRLGSFVPADSSGD